MMNRNCYNVCKIQLFREQLRSVSGFNYSHPIACLQPVTIPTWYNDMKTISTSTVCFKNKTRKMIKNKAIKKDPEGLQKRKELAGKLRSHFIKYENQQPKGRSVKVWESMSLKDLSDQTGLDVDDLFDVVLNIKQLDTDYIQSETQALNNVPLLNLIAKQLQYKNSFVSDPSSKKKEKTLVDKDVRRSPPPEVKDLVARPPVVTIMGHIDHGKTSLLDYLRKSRIVAGEAGGITQHIGAFIVELNSGNSVTFIDTPGHAAFTAMRTRGATSTDIVILIVDACEGVLEQTKESLRIIRQARVPFLVALNKIDKPTANVEATKNQLVAEGVHLEDRGGDVQCVPISALQGTNVKQLVEAVLLQAEILDLKCDVKGKVEGVIIESQIEQGLGKTATVLIQRGILKSGGFLVAGGSWCKVRMLLDDRGIKLKEIRPSQVAKVVGWKDVLPSAGTEVLGVETETRAREVIGFRQAVAMKQHAEAQQEFIDENRQSARDEYLADRKARRESGWFKPKYGTAGRERQKETSVDSEQPVVAVIVKGDVDGSIDAILSCLDTYQEEEVKLEIVHFGVGAVTETDVSLAQSFNGIIYAFNTQIPTNIKDKADSCDVPVRSYSVIYHLIADLKQEITSKMAPVTVEEVLGKANVLKEFLIKDKKNQLSVAGCRVTNGKLSKEETVKVVRGQDTIYTGVLASLKHMKDEVSEINMNQECGLRVEDSEIRFQEGDTILSVEYREEPNDCKWNPGF